MFDPAFEFEAKTVTIVGTGLLGASLGLALKQRTRVEEIIGVSRSHRGLQVAREKGAVDTTATSLAGAAVESDCLVLCTPVGIMGHLMEEAGPALRRDVLVTDVGSTKAAVMRDVCAAWPRAPHRFVGAHPMAGAELKGADHAQADLFEGATVVLTPHADADPDAVDRAHALWHAVGGRVCRMSPEDHDAVVARTSHIPHLMAVLLTDLIEPLDDRARGVMGPGFLDTTRIAAGDPEMWRDICLTNAGAICALLTEVADGAHDLRELIERGDGPGLLAYLTRMRDLRAGLGSVDGRPLE